MSLDTNRFAIATALRIAEREKRERLLSEIDDPALEAKVVEWRGVLEARAFQHGRSKRFD